MSEQHEIALPAPATPSPAIAGGLTSAQEPTRVYGVDEAGRGPWLGPMAIAVVLVDAASVRALEKLGVQDSKRFGSSARGKAQRAELAEQIEQCVVDYRCALVSVDEIDRYTFRGQLNHLERVVVARLLGDDELKADRDARIICDGARLFSPMKREYPGLVAVDKGESAHVSVAAASVLAKHARDAAFAAIAEKYAAEFGPITGGGYVNKATRAFLEAYQARHGKGVLPPEARKSWGARKRKPEQLPLA